MRWHFTWMTTSVSVSASPSYRLGMADDQTEKLCMSVVSQVMGGSIPLHEGFLIGTKLKISDPSLGNKGCSAVFETLRRQDEISEIDLSGCNICKGDELAEIVQSAPNLKRLVLEWNNLGQARSGISAFSAAIGAHLSLEEVDLRSNQIGPGFAASLANALRGSRTVFYIDLRWNAIGPSGAAAFIGLLQRNDTITTLHLSGNGIPQALQMEIDNLLEENRRRKVHSSQQHVPSYLGGRSKQGLEAIHKGRMSAFQQEIIVLQENVESLNKSNTELQHQTVEKDSKVEALRCELREENLLRKFIEKEAEELKEELVKLKQEIACLQEKLTRETDTGASVLAQQKMATSEAERREKCALEMYNTAVLECHTFREQILHLKEDYSERLKDVEEKAKVETARYICEIQKLENTITSTSNAHLEEIAKVRNQAAEERDALIQEKSKAFDEIEKQRMLASMSEEKLANVESILQREKENHQHTLDSRINMIRAEMDSLQKDLDKSRRELSKLKRKHASEKEDLETTIAQQKAQMHRSELGKSDLEERIFSLTAEKAQLQEKLKLSEDRELLVEKRMELERLKCSEALNCGLSKHLEEKKCLEDGLSKAHRLLESTRKQLEQVQDEQEKTRFNADLKVLGIETAFIDWIRQQFSALRASNSAEALDKV